MRRALLLLLAALAAPAGDDALLPRLVRAIREGDPAAARTAHDVLKRMGREAWPHVMPLLDDPDPEVRLRAARLWEAMAGEVGDWWGLPVRGAAFRDGLPTRARHKATGIEMVLVPGGRFRPGPEGDAPVVEIAPFYLSATEVTQAQYRAGWPGAMLAFAEHRAAYPVTGMSHAGIAPWLARTDLRLPTEAEWEYACRAAPAPPHAPRRECAPVGERSPGALGLFDMEDNVAEWCADATVDGRRVVRGGSFADPPGDRGPFARRLVPADRRAPTIGFRVARAP